MPIQRLLPLLLLACLACSGPPPVADPLAYADLRRGDGWRLRINGDGSGILTHRQYPEHHLDYPRGTFPFRKKRSVKVIDAYFTRAFSRMQAAVDDDREYRSCKLLRRELYANR